MKNKDAMERNMILHIDPQTLQTAFDVAKVRGVDLSVVVDSFLLRFISTRNVDKTNKVPISEEVRALAGILASEDSGVDWKERKQEYLQSRYME